MVIPILWMWDWWAVFDRGLVSTSAINSFVTQYLTLIVLSEIFSWMKWSFGRKCLDCQWNCGFSDSAMVPWLSSCIGVGTIWVSLRSLSKVHSQIASWAISVSTKHSALVADRAVNVCLHEPHEMALPAHVFRRQIQSQILPHLHYWSLHLNIPATNTGCPSPFLWSKLFPMF